MPLKFSKNVCNNTPIDCNISLKPKIATQIFKMKTATKSQTEKKQRKTENRKQQHRLQHKLQPTCGEGTWSYLGRAYS